jgi:hypothetical protein
MIFLPPPPSGSRNLGAAPLYGYYPSAAAWPRFDEVEAERTLREVLAARGATRAESSADLYVEAEGFRGTLAEWRREQHRRWLEDFRRTPELRAADELAGRPRDQAAAPPSRPRGEPTDPLGRPGSREDRLPFAQRVGSVRAKLWRQGRVGRAEMEGWDR